MKKFEKQLVIVLTPDMIDALELALGIAKREGLIVGRGAKKVYKNWDKIYKEKTTPLFVRHMNELENGTRILNVDSVLKYKV